MLPDINHFLLEPKRYIEMVSSIKVRMHSKLEKNIGVCFPVIISIIILTCFPRK